MFHDEFWRKCYVFLELYCKTNNNKNEKKTPNEQMSSKRKKNQTQNDIEIVCIPAHVREIEFI